MGPSPRSTPSPRLKTRSRLSTSSSASAWRSVAKCPCTSPTTRSRPHRLRSRRGDPAGAHLRCRPAPAAPTRASRSSPPRRCRQRRSPSRREDRAFTGPRGSMSRTMPGGCAKSPSLPRFARCQDLLHQPRSCDGVIACRLRERRLGFRDGPGLAATFCNRDPKIVLRSSFDFEHQCCYCSPPSSLDGSCGSRCPIVIREEESEGDPARRTWTWSASSCMDSPCFAGFLVLL